MKTKSARPEPNGTRSRTLAQPNAGKTDEDAYKSIVGTISDTAQKHALSSKAINNGLPLAKQKQKPNTSKQQKPIKLSPKPHLLEQAKKTSTRSESIEEIFGDEVPEDTFVTTNALHKLPRKRLPGIATSSPINNDDLSDPFYIEEEPANDTTKQVKADNGKV